MPQDKKIDRINQTIFYEVEDVMRNIVIIFIMLFSLVSLAEDCIDLTASNSRSTSNPEQLRETRETDEITTIISQSRGQIGYCIDRFVSALGLEKQSKRKDLSFDMQIRVSSQGSLIVKCDCEEYIKTSQDLNEARYRLEVGKCVEKVLSKSHLPKGFKISDKKLFCWNGKSLYGNTSAQTTSQPGVK